MTVDHKEARVLVDDLRLVAKCLKGENKFPTGQSVILESAATLTAALAEIERLRGENAALRTEKHADAEAIGALREVLLDATAHLAGASSAYKTFATRHPKWGTPAPDALFGTRFKDFDAAVGRARAALKGPDQ